MKRQNLEDYNLTNLCTDGMRMRLFSSRTDSLKGNWKIYFFLSLPISQGVRFRDYTVTWSKTCRLGEKRVPEIQLFSYQGGQTGDKPYSVCAHWSTDGAWLHR